MSRIMLAIDLQHDFLAPTGKLSVFKDDPNSYREYVTYTLHTMRQHLAAGGTITASLDSHPKRHPSFKIYGEHCVQATLGAQLIPEVQALFNQVQYQDQIIIVEKAFHTGDGPDAQKDRNSLVDGSRLYLGGKQATPEHQRIKLIQILELYKAKSNIDLLPLATLHLSNKHNCELQSAIYEFMKNHINVMSFINNLKTENEIQVIGVASNICVLNTIIDLIGKSTTESEQMLTQFQADFTQKELKPKFDLIINPSANIADKGNIAANEITLDVLAAAGTSISDSARAALFCVTKLGVNLKIANHTYNAGEINAQMQNAAEAKKFINFLISNIETSGQREQMYNSAEIIKSSSEVKATEQKQATSLIVDYYSLHCSNSYTEVNNTTSARCSQRLGFKQ